MTPPNLLTEWARLLIGALARAGVGEAVISPGSRSTPFTWAALHEPGLRCRTIIDERSAAFFAVGQAKITGMPTLLVCTSGSAAANYFPALVEADRSGTPLIVLTADRPFELQAADAPQTIDQVKLYGQAVRHYFEIGMPDPSAGALRGLRRIASHATMLTRGPVPGPVHLNARARLPLEPLAAEGDEAQGLAADVNGLLDEAATVADPRTIASWQSLAAIEHAAREARRGVIVCGPMSPQQAPVQRAVARLARVTGFPILPEATSQLRFGPLDEDAGFRDHGIDRQPRPVRILAFDALLRSRTMLARFEPDCVIRIGATPTSTAYGELLDRGAREGYSSRRIREHVITPLGWSDPHGTAATMAIGLVEPAISLISMHLMGDEAEERPVPEEISRARAEWRDLLTAADAAAQSALASLRPTDEGSLIRALVEALPDGSLLGLGNSLPVREVDTFAPGCDRDVMVWAQRGANGIDGLIAGGAGAAAASGRPTALLIGDVSALHDIGALAVARECEQPLAIVVIDNGGGRIFERLSIASSDAVDADAWQAWLTPPDVDFEAAAKAFGVQYTRATAADEARTALATALGRGGVTLLHVVVDGARTIPAHREYWADVDRRIAALP